MPKKPITDPCSMCGKQITGCAHLRGGCSERFCSYMCLAQWERRTAKAQGGK